MSRVSVINPADGYIIHSNFPAEADRKKFSVAMDNNRSISDEFNENKKRKRQHNEEQCKKMRFGDVTGFPYHGRPLLYVLPKSVEERRAYVIDLNAQMDLLLPPVVVRPQPVFDNTLEKDELFFKHVSKLLAVCNEFLPAACVSCDLCKMPYADEKDLPEKSYTCYNRSCSSFYCPSCMKANGDVLRKHFETQMYGMLLCSCCFKEVI